MPSFLLVNFIYWTFGGYNQTYNQKLESPQLHPCPAGRDSKNIPALLRSASISADQELSKNLCEEPPEEPPEESTEEPANIGEISERN